MNLARKVERLFENLENGFPTQRLGIILQYKDAILQWLHTQEFQEKYQHSPYPPLLNPQNIAYAQTDPEVAWDLNLPLPPFEMLLLCPHGTGVAAMLRFLRMAEGSKESAKVAQESREHRMRNSSAGGGADLMRENLNVSYNEGLSSAKEYYLYHYRQLVANQGKFNVVSVDCFGRLEGAEEREKFFTLIPKSVPALMQTRDPISMIKHSVARNWECITEIPSMQRHFNLTFDYHYFRKFLEKKDAEFPIDFEKYRKQGFIFNSLVTSINPQFLLYTDVKEISKERAFETMGKLSNLFGFRAPKEENRKIYEAQTLKGNLLFLWSLAPLELYVHPKDIAHKYSKKNPHNVLNPEIDRENSLKIFIVNPQKADGYEDIMPMFSSILQSDVALYISPKEWESLRKNQELWEATRQYLQEFLDFLGQIVEQEEKKAVTEEKILEHLRANKQARENLQKVLEPELKHIKRHSPEMIKGWKYYLEFTELCKRDA